MWVNFAVSYQQRKLQGDESSKLVCQHLLPVKPENVFKLLKYGIIKYILIPECK
jgi:hypothetical protein